ncbi:MAG: hypothetical protein L6V81_10670 [Clostridium sp.]|nr:MAG: hypothetical protein L6V81_10670 [Clostridium sp.]
MIKFLYLIIQVYFCNDIDTICIKFDNKGKIDKLSKLDLIEEKKMYLKICEISKKYKLEYKTIKKMKFHIHIILGKKNITINNLIKIYRKKEKEQ